MQRLRSRLFPVKKYLIILALCGSVHAEAQDNYARYRIDELESEASSMKRKVEELEERFFPKPKSDEDLLTRYQKILERAAAPRRQLEAENAQKNADFAAASKQQQQKYAEMIAKQAADAAAARAHTAQLEEERRIATMREIERRYGRAKDQSR